MDGVQALRQANYFFSSNGLTCGALSIDMSDGYFKRHSYGKYGAHRVMGTLYDNYKPVEGTGLPPNKGA